MPSNRWYAQLKPHGPILTSVFGNSYLCEKMKFLKSHFGSTVTNEHAADFDDGENWVWTSNNMLSAHNRIPFFSWVDHIFKK